MRILVPAKRSPGKNILPRVAALLDVMQISEVPKIHAPNPFERPIYAGNAIEMVGSTAAIKVSTVRAAAFPSAGGGAPAPIEANYGLIGDLFAILPELTNELAKLGDKGRQA